MKRGARNAYGTHRQTVHRHRHKTENMLNTATNFGFTAVILFLFFGQELVAVAFFSDFVANVFG